jgi:hypothetical protein
MNAARGETRSHRMRRGLLSFAVGLVLSLGLVWASGLGTDDRNRSSRVIALDMSAACQKRDGTNALAFFDGRTLPAGWRCAHQDNDDDDWVTIAISPAEACTILHGHHTTARRVSANNPFTWLCVP